MQMGVAVGRRTWSFFAVSKELLVVSSHFWHGWRHTSSHVVLKDYNKKLSDDAAFVMEFQHSQQEMKPEATSKKKALFRQNRKNSPNSSEFQAWASSKASETAIRHIQSCCQYPPHPSCAISDGRLLPRNELLFFGFSPTPPVRLHLGKATQQ